MVDLQPEKQRGFLAFPITNGLSFSEPVMFVASNVVKSQCAQNSARSRERETKVRKEIRDAPLLFNISRRLELIQSEAKVTK